VWYLSALLASFIIIIVLRIEGRRKRMLASKIPGPEGMFLVGLLPLLLNGPEKLIIHGRKLYRM